MNILLTNDDGYNAEGLQTLLKKLIDKTNYNIKVCAPLDQKSAVGHGVTLFKPMKYIEIENGYAVNGTPADCIKTAVWGFYKNIKFDLVVSGINKGINMGHDIFYSGTVAGAREGLINNISGIACSRRWDWEEKNLSFNESAELMVEIIKDLEVFYRTTEYFLT